MRFEFEFKSPRAIAHSAALTHVYGQVRSALVVDDCAGEGEDEAAGAAALGVSGAVLHVLPEHADVLLVQAHRLLHLPRVTCSPKP